MTIIVCLACQDGLVLASDSQRTEENGIKDSYTRKIIPIKMDGASAMVAQSGHADLAARAVEILKHKAAGKKLTHFRTLADLAEESVAEVKQLLRQQGHELGQFLKDYTFELVIAHYFDSKPCIFLLKAEVGLAIAQQKRVITAGCGAPMANLLLQPFQFEMTRVNQGGVTAIYVIQKVKEFDSRCGGPVVAGVIYAAQPDRPLRVPSSFIEQTADALKDFDKARTTTWMNELLPLIERIVSRRTMPNDADLDSLDDPEWE